MHYGTFAASLWMHNDQQINQICMKRILYNIYKTFWSWIGNAWTNTNTMIKFAAICENWSFSQELRRYSDVRIPFQLTGWTPVDSNTWLENSAQQKLKLLFSNKICLHFLGKLFHSVINEAPNHDRLENKLCINKNIKMGSLTISPVLSSPISIS